MTNYNLTILINNKVEDKAKTGLIDDLKKNFGNLVKEDLWGVRTLAYEIKHMDKAYFAHFEFESEPDSVITLDRNIRLNENIIRYLLVKSKKAKRITAGQAKRTAKAEAAKSEPEAKQSLTTGKKEKAESEIKAETKETKKEAPATESKGKKVVQIRPKKKA